MFNNNFDYGRVFFKLSYKVNLKKESDKTGTAARDA